MKNNADKEISELTRNIQAAQARMNNISAAIGRVYYAQKKDEPEPEYVQMFNDMDSAEKQIEQMQTRIKFLNGIVVCTNCKADNSVHSAFCASCGSRLPHTYTADGANRCSRCGNLINPGQLFCGSCGQKVETIQQPAPIPVSAPQPSPAPAPAAEPVPVSASTSMTEPAPMPVPAAEFAAAAETAPVPEFVSAAAEDAPASEPVPTPVAEGAQPETAACCPNCKTPIQAADALFCAECGTRLR